VQLIRGHIHSGALDQVLGSAGAVVAIGNFDGVHRGHQELLARTCAAARRLGDRAVALTFDPHPARVLAPHLAPRLITSCERKLALLAEHGIELCLLEPFDAALARLGPAEFVERVLVRALRARHVVVGYDFTYGHKRSGNVAALRDSGQQHGFTVEAVEPVTVDGIVASSSRVRDLVSGGNLEAARRLLGRDFAIDGLVVRGAGRGRGIGIPTANLAPTSELLPEPGIYAVRCALLPDPPNAARSAPGAPCPEVETVAPDRVATSLAGAASLGTNPTFVDGGQLTLEVHLLDFSGDLYGRHMRVEFVQRLRPERRFREVDELLAQIRRDIEQARALLSGAGPGE
jgi:riboflavin kinase/FMN adenylyltransferase